MIKSKNLNLRALEKHDLPFLHRLHNDSNTMSYFFEEPFETVRELEDLYEKHVHNQMERRFILQEISSGNSVGVLSILEINEINRNGEIDIIIDERFRGNGFGKEGFVLGTKYAFDILNLHKLYLQVLPTNIAGRKIYEYIGYKKEARLRQEYYVDGKYIDVLRMYIFDQSWRRIKKTLNARYEFDKKIPQDQN